mgnify:CR=1 FL=1
MLFSSSSELLEKVSICSAKDTNQSSLELRTWFDYYTFSEAVAIRSPLGLISKNDKGVEWAFLGMTLLVSIHITKAIWLLT